MWAYLLNMSKLYGLYYLLQWPLVVWHPFAIKWQQWCVDQDIQCTVETCWNIIPKGKLTWFHFVKISMINYTKLNLLHSDRSNVTIGLYCHGNWCCLRCLPYWRSIVPVFILCIVHILWVLDDLFIQLTSNTWLAGPHEAEMGMNYFGMWGW